VSDEAQLQRQFGSFAVLESIEVQSSFDNPGFDYRRTVQSIGRQATRQERFGHNENCWPSSQGLALGQPFFVFCRVRDAGPTSAAL
jgi:hypothetical protein